MPSITWQLKIKNTTTTQLMQESSIDITLKETEISLAALQQIKVAFPQINELSFWQRWRLPAALNPNNVSWWGRIRKNAAAQATIEATTLDLTGLISKDEKLNIYIDPDALSTVATESTIVLRDIYYTTTQSEKLPFDGHTNNGLADVLRKLKELDQQLAVHETRLENLAKATSRSLYANLSSNYKTQHANVIKLRVEVQSQQLLASAIAVKRIYQQAGEEELLSVYDYKTLLNKANDTLQTIESTDSTIQAALQALRGSLVKMFKPLALIKHSAAYVEYANNEQNIKKSDFYAKALKVLKFALSFNPAAESTKRLDLNTDFILQCLLSVQAAYIKDESLQDAYRKSWSLGEFNAEVSNELQTIAKHFLTEENFRKFIKNRFAKEFNKNNEAKFKEIQQEFDFIKKVMHKLNCAASSDITLAGMLYAVRKEIFAVITPVQKLTVAKDLSEFDAIAKETINALIDALDNINKKEKNNLEADFRQTLKEAWNAHLQTLRTEKQRQTTMDSSHQIQAPIPVVKFDNNLISFDPQAAQDTCESDIGNTARLDFNKVARMASDIATLAEYPDKQYVTACCIALGKKLGDQARPQSIRTIGESFNDLSQHAHLFTHMLRKESGLNLSALNTELDTILAGFAKLKGLQKNTPKLNILFIYLIFAIFGTKEQLMQVTDKINTQAPEIMPIPAATVPTVQKSIDNIQQQPVAAQTTAPAVQKSGWKFWK